MAEITIIGCGPGSADFLTAIGRRAALEADVLIGAPKMLNLFPESNAEKVEATRSLIGVNEVQKRLGKGKKIAVLVSGDPGISSMAKPILRNFGIEKCHVIPGISSVQMAFAKVGMEWFDARIITAHKRDPDEDINELAKERKIIVLAGRAGAIDWIAQLGEAMGPKAEAIICENLSMPGEKVLRVPASTLKGYVAPSMTVVILVKT